MRSRPTLLLVKQTVGEAPAGAISRSFVLRHNARYVSQIATWPTETTDLRLPAQRALWGHVPPSLRSVSLEMGGSTIVFRAVFEPGAGDTDRVGRVAGPLLMRQGS